jgi:hypothetical protein
MVRYTTVKRGKEYYILGKMWEKSVRDAYSQ